MSRKSNKNTGKGGTKRHRPKIVRENILGVTKPAIRRMARRGGVKRFSGSIYEETRSVLKVFMEEIIRDAIVYCEHNKRKTVSVFDVVYSLNRHGRTIYGFGGNGEFDFSEPKDLHWGRKEKTKTSKPRTRATAAAAGPAAPVAAPAAPTEDRQENRIKKLTEDITNKIASIRHMEDQYSDLREMRKDINILNKKIQELRSLSPESVHTFDFDSENIGEVFNAKLKQRLTFISELQEIYDKNKVHDAEELETIRERIEFNNMPEVDVYNSNKIEALNQWYEKRVKGDFSTLNIKNTYNNLLDAFDDNDGKVYLLYDEIDNEINKFTENTSLHPIGEKIQQVIDKLENELKVDNREAEIWRRFYIILEWYQPMHDKRLVALKDMFNERKSAEPSEDFNVQLQDLYENVVFDFDSDGERRKVNDEFKQEVINWLQNADKFRAVSEAVENAKTALDDALKAKNAGDASKNADLANRAAKTAEKLAKEVNDSDVTKQATRARQYATDAEMHVENLLINKKIVTPAKPITTATASKSKANVTNTDKAREDSLTIARIRDMKTHFEQQDGNAKDAIKNYHDGSFSKIDKLIAEMTKTYNDITEAAVNITTNETYKGIKADIDARFKATKKKYSDIQLTKIRAKQAEFYYKTTDANHKQEILVFVKEQLEYFNVDKVPMLNQYSQAFKEWYTDEYAKLNNPTTLQLAEEAVKISKKASDEAKNADNAVAATMAAGIAFGAADGAVNAANQPGAPPNAADAAEEATNQAKDAANAAICLQLLDETVIIAKTALDTTIERLRENNIQDAQDYVIVASKAATNARNLAQPGVDKHNELAKTAEQYAADAGVAVVAQMFKDINDKIEKVNKDKTNSKLTEKGSFAAISTDIKEVFERIKEYYDFFKNNREVLKSVKRHNFDGYIKPIKEWHAKEYEQRLAALEALKEGKAVPNDAITNQFNDLKDISDSGTKKNLNRIKVLREWLNF